MFKKYQKIFKGLVICAFAIGLQACVTTALVGVSGIVATKVAGDSRVVNRQVSDTVLWNRATTALTKDEELQKNSQITVVAYNGNILLIGRATDQDTVTQAENIVLGVEDVQNVYTKIKVGQAKGLMVATNDAAITAVIKSKLLAAQDVRSNAVKVITEDQEVFLFGRVTKAEASKIVDIARNSKAVVNVYTAFELID